MAQSSGPISQGTNTERQMTDVLWRNLFGDEPGVVGDTDGSAYFFTPVAGTDTAQIGSQQIDSQARVAGFAHKIPAGQPEPIDIPAATGSARTDLIALRYDPTYTGALGPVRLIRIAGTSSAIPSYDAAAPGVEDLPLIAVTRQPGQALTQATWLRVFPRLAPTLHIDGGVPLPLNSPLGTRVRQGGINYLREYDSNGNVVWKPDRIATSPAALSLFSGINNGTGSVKPVTYWREEKTAFVVGTITLASALTGLATRAVADVPAGFRPTAIVTSATNFNGRFEILASGRVNLLNGTIQEIPKEVPLPLHLTIPLG